jgi:HK97 family phage prohead protease
VAEFRTAISRAAVTEDGTLRGYAAVFDQPTTRQADYAGTESIARGAFDGLLDRGDVLALVDHDFSKVLGRTANGTVRLKADDHGLAFEIDLPDTTLGRDIRALVARGDLTGMSFSAVVGEVERTAGGVVHRSFKELIDISVVTMPAYVGTSVVARNAGASTTRREQLIRARQRARSVREDK